jgi:hypothetical protein
MTSLIARLAALRATRLIGKDIGQDRTAFRSLDKEG